MNYFKKCNNWTGWAVFAVVLVAYVLTTEPTGSWWDCMEFIATSYKMQVGHPPGAPFFTMLMRIFTLLSFGDPEAVGFAANLMSCVASAFCILFMFWTITRLARKTYGRNGDGFDAANKTHVWTVIGAGTIGSLAYAFTDTFWFSGVEGEVYALSSMFTALVVWLMLKWEEVADQPYANRWLVLIAYMMGLSIGVHILNLLAIPALVFIYYFRKSPQITKKGVLWAVLAAAGILAAIYVVIMPYTVSIGAWFDRLFVNGLGLPVNSGMVFWVLLLLALIAAGVWFTHKKGKVLWNTVLLCTGVILIGYSSYASTVIRSSVNPPMNSNRPDNPFALQSLLNRIQYGSSPILFGPAFSSPPIEAVYSKVFFINEKGRYESREVVTDYKYPSEAEFFFPRMWSHEHAEAYKTWVDFKGRSIRIGEELIKVPTFGENLKFFFGYQFNFMYWRYFMWNFVGRQDDIQGSGDILHGNWLSGFNFIDELYIGPQTYLPYEIERNKGRNTFFFLPFLLGVLGLIYQLGKDKRGFTIVMALFVMMGLALVVYFNLTPNPPRERDYIYAGSFYAFAIWIGFGVMWVQEIVAKMFKKRECYLSALIAAAVCAVVPVLLAAQGWDDHDRSHRYIGRDIGFNFLSSTLPNSIIMNYGDNDTFPLWYNQEVEEVRPDVRIMNMSYIAADWYIEQMRHAYNGSEPVPLSIPMRVYFENEFTYVEEVIDRPMTLQWIIDFVKSRDPRTQGEINGRMTDYIPTRKVALPVNRENAVASGIVKPEDAHLMVDTVYFELPKGSIRKDQLVLLDLLSNFDWSRPLYFTMARTIREIGLGDWLQADGYAYRLVPIKTPFDLLETGRMDTELTYDLLMNTYRYGNAKDPRVYVDWTSVVNLRFTQVYNVFARLARQLSEAGDDRRAVEVLDRVMEEYPHSQMNYDFWSIYAVIEAYYYAGATEQGDLLLEDYANVLVEYIEYYLRFTGRKAALVEDAWYERYRDLRSLAYVAHSFGRTEQYEAITEYLKTFGESDYETDETEPLEESPAI